MHENVPRVIEFVIINEANFLLELFPTKIIITDLIASNFCISNFHWLKLETHNNYNFLIKLFFLFLIKINKTLRKYLSN